MVFPARPEASVTRTRKRLTERPYSFTSSLSDLLPEPELSDLRRLVRNHLLSGSSTNVPTVTQIRPTGRKVKNDSLS